MIYFIQIPNNLFERLHRGTVLVPQAILFSTKSPARLRKVMSKHSKGHNSLAGNIVCRNKIALPCSFFFLFCISVQSTAKIMR